MVKNIWTVWTDFLHLFFPKLCLLCRDPLIQAEEQLCLKCLCELPHTNYHKQSDNRAEQLFWGKIQIESAYAFLHFQKGGNTQKLIHSLKYHENKEIGTILGKIAATEIFSTSITQPFDFIIPVPLHRKRKKERGYNQSEYIALGISEVLNIPVNTSVLFRENESVSQVSKNVYERWINTQSLFIIAGEETLIDKHILLVDDVMTSGSTLSACAETLLSVKGIKVSLFSLAIA